MATRSLLPADTLLDGKYRIDHVIGTGGFGITYAAHAAGLGATVAVKEYYPVDFGTRDGPLIVRPSSDGHALLFDRLKAGFVREAQTLIKFRHNAIVRVLSVFEAHGTAYMVMEFEAGRSLKAWLAGLGRPPTQAEIDAIVVPLLDALEVVHAASYLHRDIAPDNIIIRHDGSPVLIDFGASRQVAGAMTGLIKGGFSPQEQYANDPALQGPWTDLYALGATLSFALTGKIPEQAPARGIDDTMRPLRAVDFEGYRPAFLAGIDAALQWSPKDRPQTVAAMRQIMYPKIEPALSSVPNLSVVPRLSVVPAIAARPQASFGAIVDERGPHAARPATSHWPKPRAMALVGAGLIAVVLAATNFAMRRPVDPAVPSPGRPDDIPLSQRTAHQLHEEAQRYFRGDGVERDYQRARILFEQAVARGHGPSMHQLGWLHEHALGLAQSYVAAREWYEKAAAAGHYAAMNNLGYLHDKGLGVSQDFGRAREWYEKAAAGGEAAAMENIAVLYREGHGVAQSTSTAFEWYQKAANAGEASSMNWVGRFHQEGWSTAVDKVAARQWFLKAAEADDEDGMWNLSTMLDAGDGGPANAEQAAHWLLQAAKAGNDHAKTALAGDMSVRTKTTRIAVKRELKRRDLYSGTVTDAWTDEVRRAVESFLAK